MTTGKHNSKSSANKTEDSPLQSGYEKRVIAFIDILGFRALLSRMTQEPNLFETIRDALESVMEHGIMSRQAAVLDASYTPFDLEATAFSDCYAVSARVGNELLIVNLARQLVLCLLEVGIMSRGAIIIGDLYHVHPVVFGQGLVDAYELEISAAHYPRIIVSDEVIAPIRERDEQQGTTYSEGIIRDSDGCWFVDIYRIWPRKYLMSTYEGSRHKKDEVIEGTLDFSTLAFISVFLRIRGHLVEHLLREHATNCLNLNRISKLRWLAERFNEAMIRLRTKIELINLEVPQHEAEWMRSEFLRCGRQLRPQPLPFTLEDIVRARQSSMRKKENK